MSERKLDWRATWKRNSTALMLFSLLIRPIIIGPLILLEIMGEWASDSGWRVPAAEPVWKDIDYE